MTHQPPLLPMFLAGWLAGLLGASALGGWIRSEVGHRPPAQLPDTVVVRRTALWGSDYLPDAGIAVFDSLQPRIYLNARLLAQLGPDMAAFLRAHEEGHIAYHHVSERRFGLARLETPVPILHRYEFAADCYAGQMLRERRPSAIHAALRFFQHRRELVTDRQHPPMGARADSLIACLTDPARRLR